MQPQPALPRASRSWRPALVVALLCAALILWVQRQGGVRSVRYNLGLLPPMQIRLIAYTSGGRSIRMECYAPRGTPRHACILLLHGADGLAVNRPWLSQHADVLTAMGYAVYAPHYLERSGLSMVSSREVMRQQFDTWLDTAQDGLDHALHDAQCERGGVMGISLGGFLTTALAARDRRVLAAVELCGGSPAHLPRQLQTTPSAQPSAQRAAGMAPPATNHPTPLPGDVGYTLDLQLIPPMLLVHGALDPQVPVEAAHLLDQALLQHGRPHELVVYPNQQHGFVEPEAREVTRRAVRFFSRKLP